VTTIGFLHTASVHEATFERLVADHDPTVTVVHVTRPDLLARAQSHGLGDGDVVEGIAAALGELNTAGATMAVCTCSTIGALAERPAVGDRCPVLRVDRPMARAAVERGGRIAVVAAVESTIATTVALLREEATTMKAVLDVELRPCLDAWTLFESGNSNAYVQAIADHIDALPDEFSTIVLAQASMMDAARLTTNPDRVLCSPRSAVEHALFALGSAAAPVRG
jgi:Asp/Glu/Hydantoin racemase